MTELCDLADKYGTDKHSSWNYTPKYFEIFADRRELVRKVLEIGVDKGASLRLWKHWFPNAEIYGVDVDEKCQVQGEERILTFHMDAYTESAARILSAQGPFDIIVDDANHTAHPQAELAKLLWPSLKEGGIYLIEEARLRQGLEAMLSAVTDRVEVQPTHDTDYSLVIMRK